MIENIEDHMALACGCGSTQWAYLRSGKIECHKCKTVHDIRSTESTKTLMKLIRDKDMQLAELIALCNKVRYDTLMEAADEIDDGEYDHKWKAEELRRMAEEDIK